MLQLDLGLKMSWGEQEEGELCFVLFKGGGKEQYKLVGDF